MMILNLSLITESLAKPLVMAKLNMAFVKFKKPSKTAVVLIAGVTISGTPCPRHRTIWCRSTFGSRGPGLSNPTSFLRPALPMAPTTDNNARDKRSVPRPNPATFLRDFTLYMTLLGRYFMKKVSKLYYLFNPLLHMLPIGNM